MIDVVANPEAAVNQLRHAGAGPQVAGKSQGLRAAQQGTLQLPLLRGLEPRGTPGGRPGLQTPGIPPPKAGLPAPHAAAVDAQLTGHVDGRIPLAQQFQGAETTPLQFAGTPGRSHAHLRESL